MEQIKIQIPSLPENIRIVESFIDNVKDKYHINDNMYGNIMVAITEAVNNAILHGNNSDRRKLVDLSLVLEENEVSFTVEDQGEGFDFDNLPDPTAPENIEKEGGRGIFLIKNLSNKYEYKQNGRIVEISFDLEEDDA